MSEYLKKNKKNFRFLLSVYIIFQYQAKSRTSASEGMRHAFFNSLGPSVHRLPDSKYWQLFMKVTESPPRNPEFRQNIYALLIQSLRRAVA